MKVKSLSHVQLCDRMDCSLPGSSVHGIFQAEVLEMVWPLMTGVLTTGEETQTQGGVCGDMGSKGHVMVQGVTGAMLPQARGQLSPQKLEEAREDLPWKLGRECGPANTLISDFQPPEL